MTFKTIYNTIFSVFFSVSSHMSGIDFFSKLTSHKDVASLPSSFYPITTPICEYVHSAFDGIETNIDECLNICIEW